MKTLPYLLPLMSFPIVDTKNPVRVAAAVRDIFNKLYSEAPTSVVDRLFADVDRMFTGSYLDYQAIDIGYHDYEHTLQATLCYALIFEGRHKAGAEPKFSARDFELGLAAVLLHDTGYLKLRSDKDGTSAKYTHVHVLRSGAFAASYVPLLGFNAAEADTVARAIHCTGNFPHLAHQHFNAGSGRLLASMLVTADYLGQMAARDYCDELETLFLEFKESDEFFNQTPGLHLYQSAHDLAKMTPEFWRQNVLPKLDSEYDGVYKYLAVPFPGGSNPYLEAVERNVARIAERNGR
jgi:hypothetical protein